MASNPATPPPDDLGQILADLEEKYQKPDPQKISLQAERAELVFNGTVAPFLGLNGFLAGGIGLSRLYPGHLTAISVCYLGASLAVIGWIYWQWKRRGEMTAVFAGAAPACLLAAALNGLPGPAAFGGSLALTYAFAALVYAGKVPQSAVPVYVLYLPVMLHYLGPGCALDEYADFFTLVPMAILFLRRRFRMASSAVIAAGAAAAWLEPSQRDWVAPLTVLLFALVCLAIWYELRIPRADYSNLRATLDQALLVLLGYLALNSLNFQSHDRLIWIWAAAVVLYQAAQSWREKLGYPTRAGVAGIALTAALWDTRAPLPAWFPIAATLLTVGLMNLAALRTRSGFVSNVSFLLLIPGALNLLSIGENAVSSAVILLGTLTTAAALLISARPACPAPLPWWRGFLRQEHWDWARSMLLAAGGALLRIPMLAFFFKTFRTCFLWLRYFKGSAGQFGFTDLVYAAAHYYGATVLSRQSQLIAAARGGSPTVQLLSAALVWVAWGAVVFLGGMRSGSVYRRLIGALLAGAPCVVYLDWAGGAAGPFALVAVVVGGTWWVIGIVRRWRADGREVVSQ